LNEKNYNPHTTELMKHRNEMKRERTYFW